MAYEELTIYAIQQKSVKSFDHRFRTFTSKSERDRTFKFLVENQPPDKTADMDPVILRVIVETDNVEQLDLDLFAETAGT